MGSHKSGQEAIGAYVQTELREYLDKLVIERDLSTRSEALRAIIIEHMNALSSKTNRNLALTPVEPAANRNTTKQATEMNIEDFKRLRRQGGEITAK